MFRYDKAVLRKITPYLLFVVKFFDKKYEGITAVIISQKKLVQIKMHHQTAESRNRVHVKSVGRQPFLRG
jgi:hypothetical protein